MIGVVNILLQTQFCTFDFEEHKIQIIIEINFQQRREPILMMQVRLEGKI